MRGRKIPSGSWQLTQGWVESLRPGSRSLGRGTGLRSGLSGRQCRRVAAEARGASLGGHTEGMSIDSPLTPQDRLAGLYVDSTDSAGVIRCSPTSTTAPSQPCAPASPTVANRRQPSPHGQARRTRRSGAPRYQELRQPIAPATWNDATGRSQPSSLRPEWSGPRRPGTCRTPACRLHRPPCPSGYLLHACQPGPSSPP